MTCMWYEKVLAILTLLAIPLLWAAGVDGFFAWLYRRHSRRKGGS